MQFRLRLVLILTAVLAIIFSFASVVSVHCATRLAPDDSGIAEWDSETGKPVSRYYLQIRRWLDEDTA